MEPAITTFAKTCYRASPAERISFIRAGVSASHLSGLAEAMHVSREHLLRMLDLPSTSIKQKTRPGTPLSTDAAWVSDITYIRTRSGWLYLAAVLELYSRKIVG